MRLAIYSCATSGYEHALPAQARKIAAALSVNTHKITAVLVLLVTDRKENAEEAAAIYRKMMPRPEVEIIEDSAFVTGLENYKQDAQLLIAQMRTVACIRAIQWSADRCLMLDSDVLPPPNSIRCMLDALEFDDHYYGVSFCPYPSHGGGPFLGGYGDERQPIYPDFYEDERILPEGLLAERDELRKDYKKNEERLKKIEEIIKDSPPRGNVFAMNAERYRKRGWSDNAIPGAGRGWMVEVDWTGCGCTMVNRAALALCDWTGYDGRGTEDLYLNFHRWKPAGIKIALLPHCPCDHVVRKEGGGFVHITTHHERGGDCDGHMRQIHKPWYAHKPGERFTQENDGVIHKPKASPAPAKKAAKKRDRSSRTR